MKRTKGATSMYVYGMYMNVCMYATTRSKRTKSCTAAGNEDASKSKKKPKTSKKREEMQLKTYNAVLSIYVCMCVQWVMK